MPILGSGILAVLTWETVALVAVGGFTGGLAIAVFLLLGRRSSPVHPDMPSGLGTDASPATDSFLTSASPSRRAAPRGSGRHVDVLISDEAQEAPPHQGWVIDRSAGGLALGSLQEADVGTILSVRPLEGSEHVPWVQVEVRQCCPLDRGELAAGLQVCSNPSL